MATPTNYWKLGLFVVVGFVAAVLAVLYFGGGTMRERTVDYVTYFDESVQGLEVGSQVRFRGVTVGEVKDIEIAPDGQHVTVATKLSVAALRRMGLAARDGRETHFKELPPGLRAQLVTTGLTGMQILGLDYFDPATHPPPALPFPVPERYIPATASTLKSLQEAVTLAASRIPILVDTTTGLVRQIGDLVSQISELRVGDQAQTTLKRLDDLLITVRRAVDRMTTAGVPEQAAQVLTTLDKALARMDKLLEHVDGSNGLVTSAQRATDAVGDIARNARGAGRELDDTLREVRETSAAIRRLANAIERDPDMFIKGRARSTP